MVDYSTYPLWQQNGTYTGRADRIILDAAFYPGVCGFNSFRVTARPTGLGVDVGGGMAVVGSAVGNYLVGSPVGLPLDVEAAPTSGSRIDVVCLTVRDAEASGSGAYNDWVLQVIKGVSGGSPERTIKTPAFSLALANITVDANKTILTAGDVTDRRPEATRGTSGWESYAPKTAYDGQMIAANGSALARIGGSWRRFAFGTNSGTTEKMLEMTGPALPTMGNPITWGTLTVVPPTMAPYTVRADITATMYCKSGNSNAVGSLNLRVSFDGGATWAGGNSVQGLSPNALTASPMSNFYIVTGSTSGNILVQGRVTSETAQLPSFGPGNLGVRITNAG